MTEPTDAEIMLEASKVGGLFDDLAIGYQSEDILKFARAVLARRGRPSGAGEPVAEVVLCHTPSGKRVALRSEAQGLPIGAKLYTHPSPPEGMAGWTKLPGMLPKPGTPVLLDIGKKYPIRAMWAAKHTVQAADDDTDWGEYDEATDEYWCPEGWYEWNEHEEVHWAVSETPRAWRELPPPLPAAPGPADGESNV